MLATIREREPAGDWIKFTMNIQTIFKKTHDNRVRRGLTYFWVRMTDLACKCPKIKINKYIDILISHLKKKKKINQLKQKIKCLMMDCDRSYLILGGSEDNNKYSAMRRPGMELNTRSIVIEWKGEWTSRMRRFERRAARKCK